jgi:transposase-like protein
MVWKVAQEKDWLDRLVDRIGDWLDSLTEKDETTELATSFQERAKKKT